MSEPPDDGPADDSEEHIAPEIPSTVDQRANRRIRNRQKREAQEAREFWQAILSSPVGRREIWRLLGDAGTFKDTFAYGPVGFPDPLATFHATGAKAWGQRLYDTLLVHDLDGVRLMHAEHDDRFKSAARASS